MNRNVIIEEWSGKALVPQKIIDGATIPFKLDICSGCFYGCKYCNAALHSVNFKGKKIADFFRSVTIKENIAKILDKELSFYSFLPQHMKRILVNSESDYYHPDVFNGLKNFYLKEIQDLHSSGAQVDDPRLLEALTKSNRDIMLEVFEVIKKHHGKGNSWMLHIQTKSPLISEHVEDLKEIQDMVQVEISFSSYDERILRKIEFDTPTIKERLEAIKKLYELGIFVRALAEPFYGNKEEALELKKMTFKYGAKAFRHKGLEGLAWENITNISYDNFLKRTRKDFCLNSLPSFDDLAYKSGEKILDTDAKEIAYKVFFPSNDRWHESADMSNFTEQDLPKINFGYSETSLLKWGHIRSLTYELDLQQTAARDEDVPSLEQTLIILPDKEASETLIEFDDRYRSRKDIYEYTYSIGELVNEDNVGKPARILGYIYSLSDPVPSYVSLTDESALPEGVDFDRETVYYITIKDVYGKQLECLPVAHKLFGSKLLEYQKTKQLYLLEGTLVSYIDPKLRQYFFYLKNINTHVTPNDLIRVRPDKKEHANKVFKDASYYRGGIRQYLKDKIASGLNIRGLDKAKDLSTAIDFMILQSFSRGLSKDGRYSNKLHSLVIGAPASGKKLLTLIAKILNPIAFELSSSGAKLTPAGLIGNVKHEKGENISNPGYLPLASSGIVCIQDFHEITKNSKQFSAILSKVMEDGEVIDSTSARTKHSAVTSVHVDMNRMSQVDLSAEYNKYTDLNIPINVLSRFDFIIEIPADVERQAAITLAMAAGPRTLGTRNAQAAEPDWQRDLKVIVAHLASTFDYAEIKEDESLYIQEKLKDLLNQNRRHFKKQKHFDAMLTRLQISVEKYAKAIACAETSLKVTKEHIDEAFSFIQYKLEFLSKIDIIEVPDYRGDNDKAARSQQILSNFSGKKVKVKDVCDSINSVSTKKVSQKTIQRDIEDLAKAGHASKAEHGYWEIGDV
jgi:DNA repair photolyase